jgi:hypothetical protein
MNEIWNGDMGVLTFHLKTDGEWNVADQLPAKCRRWTVAQVVARCRNLAEQAERRRPEAHGVGA